MRVLAIVHQANSPPGVFAHVVAERGHTLDRWAISTETGPPVRIEDYAAVLVFGGAMHVDQEDRHGWLREERLLLERLVAGKTPLLGVCLGGQLLAKALDGHVRRMPTPEIGWSEVELTPEAGADPLFSDLPDRFPTFQWHLYCFELPEKALPLARNERCLQAFRAGEAAWGVQFHAEVTHESLLAWIRSSDPAEDGHLDVPRLIGESEERIRAWNAFGRGLCARFLAVAEARAGARDATTRATSLRS